MSKLSEKTKLSHQELTKVLDESSQAIREQEEEWIKIQSGVSEKINLSDSIGHEANLSTGNDQSKMPSLSTSDDSFLHTPPPSYFDNNLRSTSTVDSIASKSVKPETDNSFQRRTSTGNYRNLLLKDLRFETRRQLGLHLDLEHPNVKNWKNVADEMQFSNLEIQNFDTGINKTQRVLNEAEVRYPDITVGDLCDILEDIDRRDVLTDIEPMLMKDMTKPRRKFGAAGSSSTNSSGRYSFQTVSSGQWNREFSVQSEPSTGMFSGVSSFSPGPPPPVPPPFSNVVPDRQESVSTEMTSISTVSTSPVQDRSISTTGSTVVSENSLLSLSEKGSSYPPSPPQAQPTSLPPDYPHDYPARYDAFVLYDVADKQFILSEFLPKVETDAGLKLFIPGRDSPAGAQIYDAQLEIMMNNCPKLIVIQSDEFLRSEMSRWSLNIALALDPAARRRKIIPVVYKRVTEPSILAGINACDRTRVLEDSWFWDGIIRSLKQSR